RRGRPHHARRRPARAARARLDGGGDRAARAGGHGAARHRLERRRHARRAGARQVQDDPPDVRARSAPRPLPLSASGHRPGDRLPRRRHGVSLDGARARGVVRRRLLRPHPAPDPPRLSTRPAALTAAARGARAGGSSLDSGAGPRPWPDVLYGAPAVAAQLENVGVWSAPPILVSGASAYRGGEFLYQDFLYDDHGAAEIPDPTDPKGGGN